MCGEPRPDDAPFFKFEPVHLLNVPDRCFVFFVFFSISHLSQSFVAPVATCFKRLPPSKFRINTHLQKNNEVDGVELFSIDCRLLYQEIKSVTKSLNTQFLVTINTLKRQSLINALCGGSYFLAVTTAADSCCFVPGAAESAKVRGNIKEFRCGDTQQVWERNNCNNSSLRLRNWKCVPLFTGFLRNVEKRAVCYDCLNFKPFTYFERISCNIDVDRR